MPRSKGTRWGLLLLALASVYFLVAYVLLADPATLSQAGSHGGSESRILSWGMEILPSHGTKEEVPR